MTGRASRLVAFSTIAFLVGCGATADQPDGGPVTGPPDDVDAVVATSTALEEEDASSSIEIVVVLPTDWPNPIYPGSPDVVVEADDGDEFRTVADGDRITLQLPSSGDYSVGAVIEDGGCYDTAGVSDSGNRAIEVDDGDVIRLRDTGEICD